MATILETVEPTLTEQLPENWVEVTYGIPDEFTNMRDDVRESCRAHGLQSFDLGGSNYRGPLIPGLLQELKAIIDRLVEAKGERARNWIHILTPAYSQEDAVFVKDRLMAATLEDFSLIDSSVEAVEKAITTGEVLKNSEGKELDVVSTGRSRISSGHDLLDNIERQAIVFSRARGLTKEADGLMLRIRKTRAWINGVDAQFKVYAALEKARRARSSS